MPENNAAPVGGRQGVNIRPLDAGSPPPSHADDTGSPPHPAASETASALIDGSSRIALPGAAEMAERNKSRSPSGKVDENEKPSLEGILSPPKEKEDGVANAAKMSKQFDHLSAPASRIQSGAATPAEPEAPATSGAQQERKTSFELPEGAAVMTAERRHRGSEVREMSAEDIKKFEDDNTLKEEDEGEEEKETQKQDAKEPEDATKTVAD